LRNLVTDKQFARSVSKWAKKDFSEQTPYKQLHESKSAVIYRAFFICKDRK
jgi:hypothetical protein